MKTGTKLISVFIAFALLAFPALSNAALIFTITRISDTVAELRATGSSDVLVFGHIGLAGATSLGDGGVDPFAGDMPIGGRNVEFVFTRVDTEDFIVIHNGPIGMGAASPGFVLTVTLDAETWGVVGTTGNVFEEVGSVAPSIGSYSIVAVRDLPEPSSIALLSLVLIGLAASRRRKQA